MTDKEWNENDWHEWRGRTEQIMSQQTAILSEIKDWLKEHARDEMHFQNNMQSHISAAAESRSSMESRFNKIDKETESLKEGHDELRSKVDELIGQVKNWKIIVTIFLGLGLALGGAMATHLVDWNEKVHNLVDQKIEQRYQGSSGTNGNGE